MSKLDDFDLDISIKKSTKKGIEAAGTTADTVTPRCTLGCPTSIIFCAKKLYK